MKNTLKCLLPFLISWFPVEGLSNQAIELKFDLNDYEIFPSATGYQVRSNDSKGSYGIPGTPMIPFLNVEMISLESGPYEIECDLVSSKILHKGISLDKVGTNSSMKEVGETDLDLTKEVDILMKSNVYPSESCRVISSTGYNGFNVVYLKVSPFIYDSQSGTLEWIESMSIKLKSVGKRLSVGKYISKTDEDHLDYLKNRVVNPDLLDHLYMSHSKQVQNVSSGTEYVIITSSALADSFRPLAEWKEAKGIRAEIITVEDIDRNYEGSDLQLKIKKCLYSLYQDGLVYALLGGDDTVVPVRGCYAGLYNKKEIDNMPTDLYYACFSGNFEWDANDNYLYGEIGKKDWIESPTY